jgi:hypothetical protein
VVRIDVAQVQRAGILATDQPRVQLGQPNAAAVLEHVVARRVDRDAASGCRAWSSKRLREAGAPLHKTAAS